MNRILSSVPRRTLLVGGALVLALALLTGIRSTNFAAAIGWYGAPACDDLEAQNPGDPNGCLFDARENRLEGNGGLAVCADGQDNDSDERTDCADPDCFGEDGCGSGEWCNVESAEFAGQEGECGGDDGVNKCSDGLDNDSDGLINCADPDCAYGQGTWSTVCLHEDPICAEYTCNAGGIGQDEASCGGNCADGDAAADHCADGQDNDGTGNGVDCADPSCANQSVCQNQVQTESDYASCGDGWDNDGDGQTDCDDPDCGYDQTGACWWAYTYINPVNWWDTYETDCGDGDDNDQDGYYDCADTADCSADYRCAVNTVSTVTEPSAWGYYNPDLCGNGYDDDADGSSDCDDGDCSGTAACAPRQCPVTEQDADGNCEADYPYWGPSCDDTYDNDGDGDGEDTNGDGQVGRGDRGVDCEDEDCRYDPACADGGSGGTFTEIQPDGYPVAWIWGNGYCVDGIDGDQNGWTDCWDDACDGQDPVCATFAGLGTEGWPYDYRYDGGDPRNGGNGHAGGSGAAVRCGDGVCQSGESCTEDCGNGTGDCGNGTCDWNEDCSSCQSDCGTCGGSAENCSNGSDDDGDGMADCDDYDCAGHTSCNPLYEICGNGYDDDADGFVDCADSECEYDASCAPPENCYTATKSALDIAVEAAWDENGSTNVVNWNRTPSSGWNEKVIDLLQSQAQATVRSAILSALDGSGNTVYSIGGCWSF